MTKNNISIGIDLGTTYSCVAIYRNENVEIIANEHGNRTTPSFISFTDDERYVGEDAKRLIGQNPENTIYDVKRLIGRKYSDMTVQSDKKNFSFMVSRGDNDKPIIEVTDMGENKRYQPEELSAMILTKMKDIAEKYIGNVVTKAVVTVPAYFNDAQRQATKDAGRIAGLDILRIINEPTAAAIAYGLDRTDERSVLIFDLGGGTLDVTVLQMAEKIFEVKSTAGDTHLGGEDFDNKLKEYCMYAFAEKKLLNTKGLKSEDKDALFESAGVSNFMELLKINGQQQRKCMDEFAKNSKVIEILEGIKRVSQLNANQKAMNRLKTACELAKKTLSTSTVTKVSIDSFYEGEDLNISLTRSKFEEICENDFNKCIGPVERALKDAKMTPQDIDDVVLVGGSTRIPKIQAILNERFPGKVRHDINPDEAVAYGAAVQAAILSGVSDNKTDSLVLIDVTPLTLGIETAGGTMSAMIKRNTSIPCEKVEHFSTFSDNQPGVTIKVYEGERSLTKDNAMLGVFDLKGIPPMPRAVPKITVIFKIDANGIMNVTAKEESTGKKNSITIENKRGRLGEDEIMRMIRDSEMYADFDKKIKDKIDSKNKLENFISSLRRAVEDETFKQKMGNDVCTRLLKMINDTAGWVERSETATTADYDEKYKKLETHIMPFIKDFTGQGWASDSDEEDNIEVNDEEEVKPKKRGRPPKATKKR